MKKVSINIKVEQEFRQKVKILAATKGKSTTELIIELLQKEFKKEDK